MSTETLSADTAIAPKKRSYWNLWRSVPRELAYLFIASRSRSSGSP